MLFGGYITRRQVELLPNERIVQARRTGGWAPGVYSIAKFELGAQGSGTKIVFDPHGISQRRGGSPGFGMESALLWEALFLQRDVLRQDSARAHHVVCNDDESEPGTFKDRILMEGDPFAVLEGMTIAGLVTGARQGYIYLRGEYPLAAKRINSPSSRPMIENSCEAILRPTAQVGGAWRITCRHSGWRCRYG